MFHLCGDEASCCVWWCLFGVCQQVLMVPPWIQRLSLSLWVPKANWTKYKPFQRVLAKKGINLQRTQVYFSFFLSLRDEFASCKCQVERFNCLLSQSVAQIKIMYFFFFFFLQGKLIPTQKTGFFPSSCVKPYLDPKASRIHPRTADKVCIWNRCTRVCSSAVCVRRAFCIINPQLRSDRRLFNAQWLFVCLTAVPVIIKPPVLKRNRLLCIPLVKCFIYLFILNE